MVRLLVLWLSLLCMLHSFIIFLMSQISSCRIFRPSRVHHFAAPDGEHGDVFLADGLGAGGSPHYHPYPNRPQHRLPPILAHFAPSGSLCRRATTPAGPPGMEHTTKSNFIQHFPEHAYLSSFVSFWRNTGMLDGLALSCHNCYNAVIYKVCIRPLQCALGN